MRNLGLLGRTVPIATRFIPRSARTSRSRSAGRISAGNSRTFKSRLPTLPWGGLGRRVERHHRPSLYAQRAAFRRVGRAPSFRHGAGGFGTGHRRGRSASRRPHRHWAGLMARLSSGGSLASPLMTSLYLPTTLQSCARAQSRQAVSWTVRAALSLRLCPRAERAYRMTFWPTRGTACNGAGLSPLMTRGTYGGTLLAGGGGGVG